MLPSTSGGLSGLPDEIITLIFRNLADLPYTDAELTDLGVLNARPESKLGVDCLNRLDLASLCKTCRRFNELATPLLYHTFVQQEWNEAVTEEYHESTASRAQSIESSILNCVRFMITLLRKPQLANHVRRIIWIGRRVSRGTGRSPQNLSLADDEQQLWAYDTRLKALASLEANVEHPRSTNYLSVLLHLDRLQDLQHRARLRSATRTLEGLLGITRQITLLLCYDGQCLEDEHRIRLDEQSIHPTTLKSLKYISLDCDLAGSQHMRLITKTQFLNLKRMAFRFYDYDARSLGPVVGMDTESLWHYGSPTDSMHVLRLELAGHDTADLLIKRFAGLKKIEIRLCSIPHFLWGWREWDYIIEALEKNESLLNSLEDLTLEAGEGDPQCRWPVAVGPDLISHMQKYRKLKVMSLHQSVFKQFAINKDRLAAPLADILPCTLERLRITEFDRGACDQLDTFVARLDSYPHLKRVEVVHGNFLMHDLYADAPPFDGSGAIYFEDYVAKLSQTLKSCGVEFVEVFPFASKARGRLD